MEPDVIVRGRESHEEGEKEKKIDAIEHTLFIIIIIHSLYIYDPFYLQTSNGHGPISCYCKNSKTNT